jgi:hypothetical protein
MAELTREYFDQIVKGLAGKDDLNGFATKEDLKSFTTKDDLKTLPTKADLEKIIDARLTGVAKTTDIDDLRTHIDASILAVQNDLNAGLESVDIKLDAIYKMVDVRPKVTAHDSWIRKLAAKTHTSLEPQ